MVADGPVVLRLRAGEVNLLRTVPLLLAAVADDSNEGQRLNPACYRDDHAAEDEYHRLMAPELDRARDEDRDLFADSLRPGTVELSEEQAEAWLRVVGEARLVLAARCGVVDGSDEDWEERAADEAELAMVGWLGHLQFALVAALSERL